MNISILFKNDSFSYRLNDGKVPFYQKLLKLQETKEIITSENDSIYRDDRIYQEEIFQDIEVYKLLFEDEYQKKVGVTKEEVKMLTSLITHAKEICVEDYESIKTRIEKNFIQQPFYAFICLFSLEDLPLHVNNNTSIISIRREFLKSIDTPDEFVSYCGKCFPNLFFHKNIVQTFNSLSAPFKEYSTEIIRHLIALNDILYPLYIQDRSKGLDNLFNILEAKANLKCSLEGDAESAKRRFSFSFENYSNEIEELICEPHTKLENTGRPGDTKYRYDRIYFHVGENNIENEKILIAHIGGHL